MAMTCTLRVTVREYTDYTGTRYATQWGQKEGSDTTLLYKMMCLKTPNPWLALH